MPLHGGFIDAEAGVRGRGSESALFARGDFGWHFTPSGSLFAYGEAARALAGPLEWEAGAAMRFTFP